MRMKFTQDITNHTRTLDRLSVSAQAHLVHGKENATLHRLLAISNFWECAPFDHTDGVIEVRALSVDA